MKFDIPTAVLQRDTRCPHAFGCLETGQCGEDTVCEVRRSLSETAMFLETGESSSCPYRFRFGDMQVCSCPVRGAIFEQYGV